MLICTDIRTDVGCLAQNRDSARFCTICGASLSYAVRLAETGSVIGHYLIEALIGFGGFGAVYRARDMRGRPSPVALKESFGAQTIDSFREEFALLHTLRHDHLPAYYEMFEAGGNGYLAMEYVPGQSLEEILTTRVAPLPEKVVLGYAIQICEALSFLHHQSKPLIHRDIKPANIRLTPDGQIKLVDFGLAKPVGTTTRSTRRAVTPAYAPIEQYGRVQTDVRSDLYALAATLYHLLTGKEPASAVDRVGGAETLAPPATLRPELSAHLSTALLRGLEISREQRWNSVAAFQSALLGTGSNSAPVAASKANTAAHQEPLRPAGAVHQGVVSAYTGSPRPEVVNVSSLPTDDKRITRENVGNLKLIHTIKLHYNSVLGFVNVGSDWNHIASQDYTNVIHIHSVENKTNFRVSGSFKHNKSHAAVNSHVNVVATTDGSEVKIWQLPDGRPLARLGIPADQLLFSADSRHLFIKLSNGIEIRRTDDWGLEATISVAEAQFEHFSVTADSRTIAAVFQPQKRWSRHSSANYFCALWNLSGQVQQSSPITVTSTPKNIQFTPSTNLLCFQTDDMTIQLWDVIQCVRVSEIRGHVDKITDTAISENTGLLATASADWNVNLVDFRSNQTLMTLKGHRAPVSSVAFHPDGQLLASYAGDESLFFWSVPDGSLIHRFDKLGMRDARLMFHPDGTRLACISEHLKIWQITP